MTREQQVYRQLAACGKYHDTGKVLIGLQYRPTNRDLIGPDEVLIQRLLLGPGLCALGPRSAGK